MIGCIVQPPTALIIFLRVTKHKEKTYVYSTFVLDIGEELSVVMMVKNGRNLERKFCLQK